MMWQLWALNCSRELRAFGAHRISQAMACRPSSATATPDRRTVALESGIFFSLAAGPSWKVFGANPSPCTHFGNPSRSKPGTQPAQLRLGPSNPQGQSGPSRESCHLGVGACNSL